MEYPNWKGLRAARGLTLRDVEKITGISNAYLSQLENGKIRHPGWEIVEKLKAFYLTTPEPSKIRCPLCKSENIAKEKISQWNGIFGPGSAQGPPIWECLICNDCGILFKRPECHKKEC